GWRRDDRAQPLPGGPGWLRRLQQRGDGTDGCRGAAPEASGGEGEPRRHLRLPAVPLRAGGDDGRHHGVPRAPERDRGGGMKRVKRMNRVKRMTVGSLIEHLTTMDPEVKLQLSNHVESYRGYYEHVAISPGKATAGELLKELKSRIGTVMYGYKGGEVRITPHCDVYVAGYGDLAPDLGITADGPLGLGEGHLNYGGVDSAGAKR